MKRMWTYNEVKNIFSSFLQERLKREMLYMLAFYLSNIVQGELYYYSRDTKGWANWNLEFELVLKR